MLLLFDTTYNSVGLVHHELVRARFRLGGKRIFTSYSLSLQMLVIIFACTATSNLNFQIH